MSDRFITLANFLDSGEAQVVRNCLEAEGIRVMMSNTGSAKSLLGLPTVMGDQIALVINASDEDRARQVLAELVGDRELGPDPDEPADDLSAEVWVCSLCGAPVSVSLSTCPDCRTPRSAVTTAGAAPEVGIKVERSRSGIQESTSSVPASPAPLASVQPAEAEEHEPAEQPEAHGEAAADLFPDLATYQGDNLARRAFLAALFGPVSCGLITLYSFWLLLRLMFYTGELSPKGMRYLYAALALDVPLLLLGYIVSRFYLQL